MLFRSHALPMYLGLDLRGGVHFLMQVDMRAALTKKADSLAGDARTLLRDNKIRYGAVDRSNHVIQVKFQDTTALGQAENTLRREMRGLTFSDEGTILSARVSDNEIREVRRLAVAQNVTTLRNRVNELGVAEPVIQRQGADRIVVVSCVGERLDHSVAALMALADRSLAEVTVEAWWGAANVHVLCGPGTRTVHGRVGETISLIPVGGTVRVLQLAGVQWPLHDEVLSPTASRSVSNVLTEAALRLSIADGAVLVIRPEALSPNPPATVPENPSR